MHKIKKTMKTIKNMLWSVHLLKRNQDLKGLNNVDQHSVLNGLNHEDSVIKW